MKTKIKLIWCYEDVLMLAKMRDITLNKKQACEILAEVERKHDATIGVNWDVIDCHIDEYLSNS